MTRARPLFHAVILAVAALAVLLVQPAAAQDTCPENSTPVSEADNVVHCKCVTGYENRGGVCKAVKAPQPVIRAASDSAGEKITALCGDLGTELNAMAAIDLKVAELNLSALGKMVHVEVGFTAEEPPEDVLREGREHLQRIVELREQIDELNGKRAWTDIERQWVLAHIYIATPNSNFSVNTSTAPARGQTAFSDLRAKPQFAGCTRPSTGHAYIPQY